MSYLKYQTHTLIDSFIPFPNSQSSWALLQWPSLHAAVKEAKRARCSGVLSAGNPLFSSGCPPLCWLALGRPARQEPLESYPKKTLQRNLLFGNGLGCLFHHRPFPSCDSTSDVFQTEKLDLSDNIFIETFPPYHSRRSPAARTFD